MLQANLHIKFVTPCLGNVRKLNAPDEFQKDHQGRILFLPAWWHPLSTFGSKLFSKHQREVKKIKWDPVVKIVSGKIGSYQRFYSPTDFKVHEALLPGTEIQIKVVLPSSIPLDDFKSIMELAGKFQGFSPYGHGERFGYFEVISVIKG
jgi:hypothetical protein